MRTSIFDKIMALLAAGLFSTVVMADPQHPSTFEALDKNSDQQISKTEAMGDRMLADGFASLDTNADGYLNRSEYQAAGGVTKKSSRSKEPSS
jgi:hypothetical protein